MHLHMYAHAVCAVCACMHAVPRRAVGCVALRCGVVRCGAGRCVAVRGGAQCMRVPQCRRGWVRQALTQRETGPHCPQRALPDAPSECVRAVRAVRAVRCVRCVRCVRACACVFRPCVCACDFPFRPGCPSVLLSKPPSCVWHSRSAGFWWQFSSAACPHGPHGLLGLALQGMGRPVPPRGAASVLLGLWSLSAPCGVGPGQRGCSTCQKQGCGTLAAPTEHPGKHGHLANLVLGLGYMAGKCAILARARLLCTSRSVLFAHIRG